tara:strand:- start:232 stop:867 length:636 start_codon:yes stop_codon:yes gene_type:complete
MKIGIIKYGLGNIGSVYHSLKSTGLNPIIINKPFEIRNVDRLIFPGVGNFARSKKILDLNGWTEEILNATLILEKPILGICLGMQLLAEWGYEGLLADDESRINGLGLIKGEVVNLKKLGCDERIPHMGWNTVKWSNSYDLLEGIPNKSDFYFVHSYAFVPSNASEIVATVDYSIPVTAVVNRDNIWGTQFHPEKSSKAGLKIMENFSNLD